MRRFRLLALLVILPVLGLILLAWWCRGIGPGEEMLRDPPLPDRAAVQRTLVPGVSTMRDAVALLGQQSRLGYGVIDGSGAFHFQPRTTTGTAARRTWMSRRIYVRGLGVLGQQRIDYREIEMTFGPPDLTLRELTDRDVAGRWRDRPVSHR
ncbi:MAG: hypothetical protein AB7O88_13665 [Reyranellaceae bacterium]